MTYTLISSPASALHSAVTRHRTVLLLLILFIGCDARGETRPTAVEVVDAFDRALQSGNRDDVRSQLAEDLVMLEQGGIDRSKQAYVAGHLKADIDFARAVTRRVIERRNGGEDTIRWVLNRYRLTGSYQGARVDRSMVETMILKKMNGRWRITHIHWSERRR